MTAFHRMWLTIFSLVLAQGALADTRISGDVKDILGLAVVDAKIVVKNAGQPLGETRSDAQGAFSVDITFGQVGELSLEIEHARVEHPAVRVRIRNFESEKERYLIQAVPKGILACLGADGAVFVGNFLSPPTGAARDLTDHVQHVLSSQVLPQLQIQQLSSHLDTQHRSLVPHFLVCKEAKPRSTGEASPLAQALGGYGLVWGTIAANGNLFDVETSIADASNLSPTPFTTMSRRVDLSRAQEAVISPLARGAVLVGVMAKLESKGQCEAAIYVHEIIAQGGDPTPAPPEWIALRSKATAIQARCKSRIPHAGLVAGGSP